MLHRCISTKRLATRFITLNGQGQRKTAVYASSASNRAMGTSQQSEYASRQVASTESVIDFSVGQPSPASLPLDKVYAAASDRLGQQGSALLLQYGERLRFFEADAAG